jgi:hypothetical protein
VSTDATGTVPPARTSRTNGIWLDASVDELNVTIDGARRVEERGNDVAKTLQQIP